MSVLDGVWGYGATLLVVVRVFGSCGSWWRGWYGSLAKDLGITQDVDVKLWMVTAHKVGFDESGQVCMLDVENS